MLTSRTATPTATSANTPATSATRRPRLLWGLGWFSGDIVVLLVDVGVAALRSAQVPDRGVAADARHVAAVRDVVDEIGVAAAAVPLDDLAALRPRADDVGEAAEREGHRVVVAVQRLHPVLRDPARRRVAVVARRDAVVRRGLPARVVGLHHVAVRARDGVVAEVRLALRVMEGVDADAEQEAGRGGDDHHRYGEQGEAAARGRGG